MAKHTHTGTCQICGRRQAVNVKSGAIAKHGYSVEWGYFNGTCPGSDRLPFEISTDAIADAIQNATNAATGEDNAAATQRMRTGSIGYVSHYVEAGYEFGVYRKSRHVRLVAEFHDVEHVREDYRYTTTIANFIDQRGEFAQKSGSRDGFYGKNAAEEATKSREAIAKEHDHRAGKLREFCEWQRARVAAWKPAELQPVKV